MLNTKFSFFNLLNLNLSRLCKDNLINLYSQLFQVIRKIGTGYSRGEGLDYIRMAAARVDKPQLNDPFAPIFYGL
ncbi:hypothetical protein D7004_14375 [Pedobacter jejuensis]|uniref:Uncharacterized protein n=1 Tax=Pedobacter jejuensis TaxID=1268550 RepID=A0A3N0BQT2_9SPHI|nr:hypothetical protein D7004_14375 [Pedobacter jejuensis]